MKIVAIIECRMGSSRLPGKSMAIIEGKPLQEIIVERLKYSNLIDDICIATTVNMKDDLITRHFNELGIKCYRGSEEDVLQRVIEAALFSEADVIVEVTGDMAFVDIEIIDLAIKTYMENSYEIVTNTRLPLYPQGIDVQVYKLQVLKKISVMTSKIEDREHVTLFAYNNPDVFNIFHIGIKDEYYHPKLRLMIDYEEDLIFAREIYKRLYHGKYFGLSEVLSLLKEEPDLLNILKGIE